MHRQHYGHMRDLVLPLLALFAPSVFAFDVQGFKDGMTPDAARVVADRNLINVVWNGSKGLYGGTDRQSQDLITLQFCDDKLVAVTQLKDSHTTLFNALVLVEEQIKVEGKPTNVTTSSYLVPPVGGGGQGRQLILEWRRGQDITTVAISAPQKRAASMEGDAIPKIRRGITSRCPLE